MKKVLLFAVALLFAFSASATIHEVSTSGITYNPNVVNATVGDTVSFTIPSNHPTREVSQSTWNANMSTVLAGGFGTFDVNFQLIITEDMLPVVYYVCVNHIGSGMKGLINVEAAVVDADLDGVNDDVDNCPSISNADQADMDDDNIGDVCDGDIDGDGFANENDAFPMDATEWAESDNDGIGDNADNCPQISNADQADMDEDGMGDVCDEDIDGDGVNNDDDDFPTDASETVDTDEDGIGNNADDDDDNDGCTDAQEIEFGTNPLVDDCTVSVEEFATLKEINIYPNPALNELNVEIESINTLISCSLYDISSILVLHNQNQSSTNFTLDISNLEPGVYFMQISDDKGIVALKKFIKE